MSENEKETVQAQIAYPCPFCGRDEKGMPTAMFNDEGELRAHIDEKHSQKESQSLPEKLTEALGELLIPDEEGNHCTSWILVTMDKQKLVRLESSLLGKDASLESRMSVEGLLVFLSENRQFMSGRTTPRRVVQ
jgi:hypothetical protein